MSKLKELRHLEFTGSISKWMSDAERTINALIERENRLQELKIESGSVNISGSAGRVEQSDMNLSWILRRGMCPNDPKGDAIVEVLFSGCKGCSQTGLPRTDSTVYLDGLYTFTVAEVTYYPPSGSETPGIITSATITLAVYNDFGDPTYTNANLTLWIIFDCGYVYVYAFVDNGGLDGEIVPIYAFSGASARQLQTDANGDATAIVQNEYSCYEAIGPVSVMYSSGGTCTVTVKPKNDTISV